MKTAKTVSLFEERQNLAQDTAWASVVYSLVPYLGIIFVPVALIASLILFARGGDSAGRAVRYIVLGVAIGAFQVFLWWLLYFIPTVGANI